MPLDIEDSALEETRRRTIFLTGHEVIPRITYPRVHACHRLKTEIENLDDFINNTSFYSKYTGIFPIEIFFLFLSQCGQRKFLIHKIV